jgi:Kef-type K+ transport system membrane component KefB
LIDYGGLLVVAVAAFVAPLLARQIPRRLVPPVVLEVVVGILIGPQVLDLVKPRGAAEVLYLLGLGFLLFLAGLDVRPERFRGPTFRLAGSAFLVSAVLAVPVAFGLRAIASGADVRLLALCLVASTLGVLVPVLRDAGEITTDFGQLMVVAGSVGEFGSLLLLTILFSAQPESTTVQVLYVLAMGAAAVVIAVLLRKLWRTRWMARTFADSDEDTSQLRVRGAFVTLMVFTALAHQFGVDALLGAFIGGMVVGISDGDERPNQERYWAKLRAIGYGFLVPVFFVMTGVQFDVRALFAHPRSLALMPLLVLAIAVVRGGPALLYRRQLGTRPALAAGLLQATTLTFPVVVAELGMALGLLSSASAAALIGASLLSVLLFPALALTLRPWTRASTPAPASARDGDQTIPEGRPPGIARWRGGARRRRVPSEPATGGGFRGVAPLGRQL